MRFSQGQNCIIGNNTRFGENVTVGHNCIIEDNVEIRQNSIIDSNTIVRHGTIIKDNCRIGSNCIIGENGGAVRNNGHRDNNVLTIGDNALIRSGSIVYAGSTIGNNFQTGHQVTIRENSQIGNNVSIGTLSDIQGNCTIGNYVRLHSNVHIGQLSQIDNFVWIFPYVVLTNDPTPPSESFVGVHIHSFAIVATGSIIMPGLELGQDCLIGAGAVVTKSVDPYAVAVGNPAKQISDVRKIRSKITGELVYPWREHFERYMPWETIGFDAWYDSLDYEMKEEYSITTILK